MLARTVNGFLPRVGIGFPLQADGDAHLLNLCQAEETQMDVIDDTRWDVIICKIKVFTSVGWNPIR